MKPVKSLNYSSLDAPKAVLEDTLSPLIASNLITLQTFDPALHSAKYRITFKSGGTEIAETAKDFLDIIEQCLPESWVYQWAADGLEITHPFEEDVQDYVIENAHMCLTDYGCSIDKFFEGVTK